MELIEYVRDDKGRPIGCVAAVDKDRLGYSICHTKDRFNKKLGRDIAIERAKKGRKNLDPKHIDILINNKIDVTKEPEKYKEHFVAKALKKMRDRAIKYYKE